MARYEISLLEERRTFSQQIPMRELSRRSGVLPSSFDVAELTAQRAFIDIQNEKSYIQTDFEQPSRQKR